VAPGLSEEADEADEACYVAALRDIEDGPGALLVADLEGRAVGVCQLIVFRHFQHGGGLCAEVESVHVHPDHRGSGIGHALMEAAIGRARQLGCYRIQLTSNAVRSDAHRFYESLGFTLSHVGFKRILS
jgi:GNAT superfamily N-acetyltransferase